MYANPPPGFGASPHSRADEEQSDLLGILFYVYGAFVAFAGVVCAGFALLFTLALFAPASRSSSTDVPPMLVGGTMMLVVGAVAFFILLKAVVMVMTGRALRGRRNHVLIYVGAVLAVMNIPLGTALAVVTFIHMQKPGVKARFGYT